MNPGQMEGQMLGYYNKEEVSEWIIKIGYKCDWETQEK